MKGLPNNESLEGNCRMHIRRRLGFLALMDASCEHSLQIIDRIQLSSVSYVVSTKLSWTVSVFF